MQNHFSVNGAAHELERSIRTVKRALKNVPPDSFERGSPRWRLSKIVNALATTADRPRGDMNYEMTALVDELSDLFDQLNERTKRLMREPEIGRRRALNLKEKFGAIIPEIGHKLKEIYDASPKDQRFVTQLLVAEAFRGCISQFLNAIDLMPSPADLARWEIENSRVDRSG